MKMKLYRKDGAKYLEAPSEKRKRIKFTGIGEHKNLGEKRTDHAGPERNTLEGD